MCTTCGCSDTDGVTITDAASGEQRALHQTAQDHGHAYVAVPAHGHLHTGPHSHVHPHSHEHSTIVSLEQDILAKNRLIAERNRGWFAGRGILALNLVSSPGSGKTTLLERTLRDLNGEFSLHVIEGDQATSNDAERLRATGCPTIQINTGTGCHLDAEMLAHGLQELNPPPGAIVMIENVGNLVCPALFDLGEQAKVVILSVTEGEDKPIKYPHMFRASQVMLLNKIDLLPYLRFDVARCIAYARQVNPALEVFQLSAQTGEGMAGWYDWLHSRVSVTTGAVQ
ncbi:hydrogenase nickel incorporation protein HypB [Glaciimonas sp. PCH181]|uniref:hydrogenase nickel incorporation protein HypB n=1 Tax=Glaciimonas sp. PCH181 TaxID=2133943 RepID=UPI000D331C09|nr:hydrogenase nickel incorporation protein HypB [Glaciimonas sp. PCH181]PUA18926.1 hydrogenase accessory protein HypB [Glaciimonas sp. PCH181]